MATPRLINAFDKTTFQNMVTKRVLTNSTIFNSSAVLRSAQYDALAAGSGTEAILPWLGELDGSVDIGALDASIIGAVSPLKMGSQKSTKDFLAKSWGISNLDARLAGLDDVLAGAADMVANFWNRTFEDLLISKLTGVVANNVANDGGDMVVKVGNDATGAVGDAQKANASSIIDAQMTMGERFDDLTLTVLHTAVYANLLKVDATSFQQPSSVQPFRTYRGMPVIVSDNPRLVSQGTNRKLYNSYFFGADQILFGSQEGPAGEIVFDVNEHAANNMGAKDLITRQHVYLHIAGHTVNNPTIAPGYASPVLAEYEKASTWTRVADRRNVKVAVLQSNA